MSAAAPMRVLGYVRVSTEEQADSGAGLAAQIKAIREEVARRGWTLVDIIEDPAHSAKDLRRPGVQQALELLDRRDADGLLVSKLDRLSRSTFDFSTLMEDARRRDWALVALDVAVDTTTPVGEAMANVMMTFAQLERRLIGQRTKEGLAAKRAMGVKLGRPSEISFALRAQIRASRDGGEPLAAIARRLNASGVPTSQGGRRWYPSSVRAVALAQVAA